MKKSRVLVVLLLFGMLLVTTMPNVLAQEATPNEAMLESAPTDVFPQMTTPPVDVLRDEDFSALWRKYDGLTRSGKISEEELRTLIAEDESDKARLLGIKVVIQAPSVAGYHSQLLSI